MKKIARILSIIFGTLAVIYITYIMFIGVMKFLADGNLNSQKYEKAADKYSIILLFEPNNENIKYKLAESLEKLPFTFKTQSLITGFIEQYEGESCTYSLVERLKKYKAQLDREIGQNYIDKAPYNNKILRWEDDAFPLKVYYTKDAEPVYQNAIKRAFEYWKYATGNFVSFIYVDKEEDANIRVSIVGNAEMNCQEGERCLYVAAVTSPVIQGNTLKSMVMNIHTRNPYGIAYSPDQVYKVTLHEIGHALGIMGHSENPDDLMYSSDQHHERDTFAQHTSILSRRDINTLNYLYMIAPNISNIAEESYDKESKIHPNVILGTKREIKERDIKDALAYVNESPNLAIGYMNLGNAYVQSDMFEEALSAYKKGFDLSLNTHEKYMFVFDMSIACLKMGNRDKALEYAQYAQKLEATTEIQEYIHQLKHPYGLSNTKY